MAVEYSQLTRRQSQIFEYVKKCIVGNQCPPTVRQIGKKFGIRSPNGVMCHLKALEKKGYIERTENESRGIKVAGLQLEWVEPEAA